MRNELKRKTKSEPDNPFSLKKKTVIVLTVIAIIALALGLLYSTTRENSYAPINWNSNTSPRGVP